MHLSLAIGIVSICALILTSTLLILLFLYLRCHDHHRKDRTSALEKAESTKDEICRYKWAEIESLTSNFSVPVVGQGGFSTVYLCTLPGSFEPIAVKVHRCGGGERLLRAFRQELELLRKIKHPRIVRLHGFSDDHEEEGALILEYLPNGSLHHKLHGNRGESAKVLTWQNRMRILFELTDAVEHLHSMDPPIVHNDITSTNVLLDYQLNTRLCDFGSVSAGFSAAVCRSGGGSVAVGSPGYVDPYYLRTGLLSKKTDVYSFGVLILEVITGLPAVGSDGRNLTAQILPCLEGALQNLMDPRLNGEYNIDEAVQMAALAVRCTRLQPGLRPSMVEIRAVMREKVRSAILTVD
ncbi:salt tolerance receptor-like cytoplasmic kinase 1 [Carex rostrata]